MRWSSGGESTEERYGTGAWAVVGGCTVWAGPPARGGGSYGAVGEIDERAHCLLTAGAKGGCRHAVGASSPGPRT
jgi:hypothetical protein